MKQLATVEVTRGYDDSGLFVTIEQQRFRRVSDATLYLLRRHRVSVNAAWDKVQQGFQPKPLAPPARLRIN